MNSKSCPGIPLARSVAKNTGGFGGRKRAAFLTLFQVLLFSAGKSVADVTPYSWIRGGEANSVYVDSSGNGRNFNYAFSTGNEGNAGAVLVSTAVGGPLGGVAGPISSVSTRWGSFNRNESAMWQNPWSFPAVNYVLEAWVLPVETGTTNGRINSQFASTGDNTGIAFRTVFDSETDAVMVKLVTFGPAAADTQETEAVELPRTRWTHVAAVNDSGALAFYVNGQVSGAPLNFAKASAGDAFVGGGSGTYNPFNGYLDEVRYSTFEPGKFAVSDLLLRAPGPSILVQPLAASVWQGGPAPFTVDVSYDESITYQWKLNGAEIAGATGSEVVVPDVTAAQSGGIYSVDILGDGVKVTSAEAALMVTPPDTENVDFYRAAVQAEASLSAYFPVDGNTGATVTNVKNNALNGTLEEGVSYDGRTDRSLGQRALRFKGNSQVTITGSSVFDFPEGGTIEAIVYLNPTVSSGQATLFSVAESDSVYYEVQAGLDGVSLRYDDDILEQPITWTVPVSLKGRFAHVAFVFDTNTVTAYVDGESLGAKEHVSFGTSSGLSANIGSSGRDFNDMVKTPWNGTIDELAIYSAPLSANTIAIHNSRFKFGTAVTVPEITSQPTGTKNLLAGGAPAFRVQATGSAPLTYSWKKDGIGISGNPTALTSTLVLNNSTPEMSGQYTVTVANPQGEDVSDPFTVVFAQPAETYSTYVLQDNPTAFWKLDESNGTIVKDYAGGFDGTYSPGTVLNAPGAPGVTGNSAVTFSGQENPVSNAIIPYDPAINTSGAFSIDFWVNPAQSGNIGRSVLASQNRNAGRSGYAVYQGLNGNGWEVHIGVGDGVLSVLGSTPPAAGRWDHVAFTWDGASTLNLYVNGSLEATATGGPYRPNLVQPLEIGSRFNNGIPYPGTIDEVAFYNHALTVEQIRKHWSIAWTPAAITQQPPATVNATEAGNITLTAAASGYPNTYQWFKDGVALEAATNPDGSARYPQGVNGATLVIAQGTPADNGSYHVVITNPLGNQTTTAAAVTVTPDASPPEVAYVTADASLRRVRVGFNRWVTASTAGVAANYTFSGGLTATGVALTEDPAVVDVITTPQTPGAAYTLSISGVRDQRTNGNLIGPNSSAFSAFTLTQGVLAVDFYYGIPGNFVDDLRSTEGFPDNVYHSDTLTDFSTTPLTNGNLAGNPEYAALGLGDNYGTRVYGWITPEAGGEYRFFIRSDDGSELYISTDANPANVGDMIAFEPGCCNAFREPADDVTQTSAPVALVAGQSYYIEAFQKEGGGGDFLEVAWRLEGDVTPADQLHPIPARFLSAYATIPITGLQTPVLANGQVVLTWGGEGKLQESDNLQTWTDVEGNPASPYTTPAAGRKFYRLVP